MGFFKINPVGALGAIGTQDQLKKQNLSAIEKAEIDMYESIKDNFKGFDKNGNAVVIDPKSGETASFASNDFKTLISKFKEDNPNSQNGSYEDWFNQNQFEDIAKQGNKFQGFDDSGNLVYRNEVGDLENFGKQGGFADFAKKQMADKKFSMAEQGNKNTVAGENKQLNPYQQRQGLGAVNNLNRIANTIANPQNVGSSETDNSTNPAPQPGSVSNSAGVQGFYQSQMTKNAEQQNKEIAKQQIAPKQTTAPSLTGMASGFAQQQAQKQAAPVIQEAKTQVTQQANQVASPYINQANAAKTAAGNQIEQATGINPFSSIQNQAINKVSEATGLDNSLLGTAVGAVANPQQALQNYAKQQAINNASSVLANTLGGDAGAIGSGLTSLASGDVKGAATGMAKDYLQKQLTDQATNLIGSQALNMIPGGVGSAINIGKALFSGGSSQDRGAAAAKAAARLAAATATGGLSEVINPETLDMGAKGLTNIKDSKTLNKMGVAGDAAKGALGLASGSMNTVKDVGNLGLNSVGSMGSTVGRSFSDAGKSLKQITSGNIAQGVSGLAESALKSVVDTFIKNPANLAKNGLEVVGGTVKKVWNAVKNFFCFDPETELLMEDGSFKKAKDIKVGDIMAVGGKVVGVGEALSDVMVEYEGVLVSASHAVFEDGVWMRVGDSKKAVKTDLTNHKVIPIANENHVIITKNRQVWADMTEIDDTHNYTEEDRISVLNSQKNKNRLYRMYMNAYKKV